MSHFSVKSLTFYGVAISSVLVLFNLVSSYGEKNLKARPSISGTYRITSANLASCLNSDNLILEIQQSGIYLSGVLSGKTELKKGENIPKKKPSLFGKWENEELILSGLVPELNTCNNDNHKPINIKAFWQNNSLEGEINLNSTKLDFMAKQEVITKDEDSQKQH